MWKCEYVQCHDIYYACVCMCVQTKCVHMHILCRSWYQWRYLREVANHLITWSLASVHYPAWNDAHCMPCLDTPASLCGTWGRAEHLDRGCAYHCKYGSHFIWVSKWVNVPCHSRSGFSSKIFLNKLQPYKCMTSSYQASLTTYVNPTHLESSGR